MAKLSKKEQLALEQEELKKEKARSSVRKSREKQKSKNQITISLNDIKYDLLVSLREKLGYPDIEGNEKGASEVFGNIVGYLLKYEYDVEPPEKSKSLHIREIYRRHRIALYWESIDELSDYGRVQKINQLGISNVDYYYREAIGLGNSDIEPEWTIPLYKIALSYSTIKKQYIKQLKDRNTKRKNATKLY